MEPDHGKNTSKRLRGLSPEWEDYVLCLLLRMILPFLPLGIELWRTGKIGPVSLTLAAAMYTISIGVASRNKLLFGFTVAAGVLYSMAFGIVVVETYSLPYVETVAGVGLVMVFSFHAVERYNRHIIDCTPFLEFQRKGSKLP